MKILELPPYFYPEVVSGTHLADDLYKHLSECGIEMEIYSPSPSRGVSKTTREKYKRRKTETLYNGKMTVHRFSMFKEYKLILLRVIRYCLISVIQYTKGSRADGIDLIYAASTPPTQGLLCGIIKRKLNRRYGKNVPFVYNLQDVFPDSIVSAGITTKESILWKVGRVIEDKTYRYADEIIVISNDIKTNIMNKGVPEKKIKVIPNWIDTNTVNSVSRINNDLFYQFGLDINKFYVVYAGNIGLSQGVETLVDAAYILKEHEEIQFVVVGDGANKEKIEEKAQKTGNVHIFPMQPMEKVSEVYSMGDLCLVACKPGLGTGAVPSKTFSIMATSTPVLLSFDRGTELWNLIEKNHCGICVEAGNADKLAEAILFAYNNEDELIKMGKKARECVENKYSKKIGTEKYLSLFYEALNIQEHR